MPTAKADKTYFILDFDSTLVKVESLELLINAALDKHPEQEGLLPSLLELKNQSKTGELSLSEGMGKALLQVRANKQHIAQVVAALTLQITDSFARNSSFLQENADHIYIASCGFKEFILPIAQLLGLKEDQVFANEFLYDAHGNIIGIDSANSLTKEGGNAAIVKQLQLDGTVFAMGDALSDYELKATGAVDTFYAFTENVNRPDVIAVADEVIASFDEFLYFNKLSRSLSYPKSLIKVLLLENVHPVAVKAFVAEGFQVEVVKGALDEAELCERIKDVNILGIRSKTVVTKKVLDCAPKLMGIGAFCIGTNQIDVKEAAQKGIPVFNAPYSNTRSVVELALGEMILLIRSAVPKSNKMHQGIWDKSANGSFEIRNKVLGLLGYGNIGTQFSVLAEALGMQVIYYDLIDKLALGNAKRVHNLDEFYALSDVISLHVDGRKENENLMDATAFSKMKDGVIFLNLSRGHVVDMKALAAALQSGKVAGAAVDVFPYEPKTNEELFENEICGLENVILTPHIGGSTEEAQENIGNFVPAKLLEYVNIGSTYGSVNFPELQLPQMQDSHRILHVHQNVPGVLAQINSVFAKYAINIAGQYLKTNEDIGYVIVDIAKGYTEAFINEIKSINGTIRMRMLY